MLPTHSWPGVEKKLRFSPFEGTMQRMAGPQLETCEKIIVCSPNCDVFVHFSTIVLSKDDSVWSYVDVKVYPKSGFVWSPEM